MFSLNRFSKIAISLYKCLSLSVAQKLHEEVPRKACFNDNHIILELIVKDTAAWNHTHRVAMQKR